MPWVDVHDMMLVGRSTGGGEVVRDNGRHGTDRFSKVGSSPMPYRR